MSEDIKSTIEKLENVRANILKEIDRLSDLQELEEGKIEKERISTLLNELSIGDFYTRTLASGDSIICKVTKIDKEHMEVYTSDIYFDEGISGFSIYDEEYLPFISIKKYTWIKIDEKELNEIKNKAHSRVNNFFITNTKQGADPCQ